MLLSVCFFTGFGPQMCTRNFVKKWSNWILVCKIYFKNDSIYPLCLIDKNQLTFFVFKCLKFLKILCGFLVSLPLDLLGRLDASVCCTIFQLILEPMMNIYLNSNLHVMISLTAILFLVNLLTYEIFSLLGYSNEYWGVCTETDCTRIEN